jgi:hypothetical protein
MWQSVQVEGWHALCKWQAHIPGIPALKVDTVANGVYHYVELLRSA